MKVLFDADTGKQINGVVNYDLEKGQALVFEVSDMTPFARTRRDTRLQTTAIRGNFILKEVPEPKKTKRWVVLGKLAKKNGWRRGAEIGIRDGRTSKYLLNLCPKLHMICVDSWCVQKNTGNPQTYEDWSLKKYEKEAREKLTPFEERADILKAFSHEAAKEICNAALDFVFLDADHGYEGTRQAILDWRPKIRSGGMVLGHDYNWHTVRDAVNEVFGIENVQLYPDSVWGVEV